MVIGKQILGRNNMLEENLLSGMTDKEKRDYYLTKMFKVYKQGEEIIDSDKPIYKKLYPFFKNRPLDVLIKYETDLSDKYASYYKSMEDVKDSVGKIIALLDEGDFSNTPITYPSSVISEYLKYSQEI